MEMYDSLFSPNGILNEQIAREIFNILPDNAPLVVFIDTTGNCWPSDTAQLHQLALCEDFLHQLRQRIDDGHEPLVVFENDCTITAGSVNTDRTNCGYVLLAQPGTENCPDLTLLEIIISQISLIAKLVEKNSLLYELQMKHCTIYGSNHSAMN